MCSICGEIPCNPRCPNAEDDVVCECSECRADILKGERYFDSNKGPICYECLAGMTVLELVELFDVDLEIAE